MLHKVDAWVILPWAQFLACFGHVLVNWLFLHFGLLDLDLGQLNAGIIMIEFVVLLAIVILVGHAPRSVHDVVGLYPCVAAVDHLRVLRGLRLEHSLLLSGIVDLLRVTNCSHSERIFILALASALRIRWFVKRQHDILLFILITFLLQNSYVLVVFILIAGINESSNFIKIIWNLISVGPWRQTICILFRRISSCTFTSCWFLLNFRFVGVFFILVDKQYFMFWWEGRAALV